ncbi:hypothetical protein KIN20_016653 [Parelaphostrongylus tenuis]|uniref:Uncharacterized protein n=1 Tax=Parelaphostrongylus tenuis TaxID=148309 RepID=A0AAD5MLX0_PARTN|nr:hypothetical protein KIN20_016653 [Parelaphostrongylus tenuis]
MPPGQERTRSFTATGFSLLVSMVYSGESDVIAKVHGISTSKDAATEFVSRLVMQTVSLTVS